MAIVIILFYFNARNKATDVVISTTKYISAIFFGYKEFSLEVFKEEIRIFNLNHLHFQNCSAKK